MFEIIDFHTHPFLCDEENLCFYKNIVKCDILKDMEEACVTRFCGSVINGRGDDFERIKKINAAALKMQETWGDKYIPGIHINPNFRDESIEEIETYFKKGVKLIGELVPYMHGWDYDHKNLFEIFDAAGECVVSLHTISLSQMEILAKEFKNITFVFAHPGDSPVLKEHIEVMKRQENVFLDLSGTGLFRYGMLKKLCSEVGAERVLFGTDYPICNLKMYIAAVLGEKITDKEKELIFSGNAKRILDLR